MIRLKILFVALFFISSQKIIAQQKFVFEQPKMGSPFTITIFANDSTAALSAATAAFHCADSLNLILSDYIDSSELNRLNATSGQNSYVPVSAALFDILQYSKRAAKESGGSYDISMGPVVKLWRKARKEKKLPDPDSLKKAKKRVGYRHIHLDSKHQSVWLEKQGMQLDVGGLGKGYVAHAALKVIQSRGINTAMVNAGGKIVVGDPPPGRDGWRIGITVPEQHEELLPRLLLLKNMSVATSGDIYQHLDIDGKRYSHIIDPKTGLGITWQRNVTAIAKDGTVSDWLSTACSVLPIRKSFRLIKKYDGAALLITEIKDGKLVQKRSALFKNYLEK